MVPVVTIRNGNQVSLNMAVHLTLIGTSPLMDNLRVTIMLTVYSLVNSIHEIKT